MLLFDNVYYKSNAKAIFGGKDQYFNIVGSKEMEAYPGRFWKNVNFVYLKRMERRNAL